MSIVEEIHERSKNLPEPLAKEVLDFLLFVSSKYRGSGIEQIPPYTSRKGAWKGRLSSSEDFVLEKAKDIELES